MGIGGAGSSAASAFGATEDSIPGAEAPLLLEEGAALVGEMSNWLDEASVLLGVAPFASFAAADCFIVDERPSPDDASFDTASILAEEASANYWNEVSLNI